MTSEGTPARWFTQDADSGRVKCELCPHHCLIADGGAGRCGVRKSRGGLLELPYYGRLSALALDPMEKKPLYHFLPGTEVLSVGFVGCNLFCPFCQNWHISQRTELAGPYISPEKLIQKAQGVPSIAFTYSEPTIHEEYVADAMDAAVEAGIATVLVTNGNLDEGPARELLARTDSANVDLKAWNEATYRRVLGGDRDRVLDFIRMAVELGVSVEVTTLVVPGLNDEEGEIAACAEFLGSLSENLPYHLSAYHPEWKWNAPPTSTRDLKILAHRARQTLRYVYMGNVEGESNTACPSCGALIIRRRGFDIQASALRPSPEGLSSCPSCEEILPIVTSYKDWRLTQGKEGGTEDGQGSGGGDKIHP